MRAPCRLLCLAALCAGCDVIARSPLLGIECTNVDHAALTLRGFQTGAELHVERYGTPPESLEALYQRGILRGTAPPPDDWDRPYVIERPAPGRVQFRSFGPDGERGTPDDLLSGEVASRMTPAPLSPPATPAASPPR